MYRFTAKSVHSCAKRRGGRRRGLWYVLNGAQCQNGKTRGQANHTIEFSVIESRYHQRGRLNRLGKPEGQQGCPAACQLTCRKRAHICSHAQ